MKLSMWARQAGGHSRTAYRWFHAGLPVPARQLATGTILVGPPARDAGEVAVYARVSSADQRADLDRQVARLAADASAVGLAPTRVAAEDMVEVLASMCARLCGRRSARCRAQRAVEVAGEASA